MTIYSQITTLALTDTPILRSHIHYTFSLHFTLYPPNSRSMWRHDLYVHSLAKQHFLFSRLLHSTFTQSHSSEVTILMHSLTFLIHLLTHLVKHSVTNSVTLLKYSVNHSSIQPHSSFNELHSQFIQPYFRVIYHQLNKRRGVDKFYFLSKQIFKFPCVTITSNFGVCVCGYSLFILDL